MGVRSKTVVMESAGMGRNRGDGNNSSIGSSSISIALLVPTSDAIDVSDKLPTVSVSYWEFTKEPTTSDETLHTLHVAF